MTRRLPFVINALVLCLLVYTITQSGLRHTEGSLTYPFDDAYTHMAVAKHLVENGVYGLTRFEFGTPCSSIIWPFLITICFKLFGVREIFPLLLNVACGIIFLFRLDAVLLRTNANHPIVRTIAGALALFTIPLPVLCVFGMEHTMHMLGLLLVITEAAAYLSQDEDDSRMRLRVGLYAALAMGSRFESVAAIAIVLILCGFRKRFKSAAIILAIGVSPPALFAVYALSHGWPALPMSVLLKLKHRHYKDISDVTDLLGGPDLERMWFEGHLGAMVLGMLLLFVVLRTREKFFSERTLLVVMPLIVTLGHIRSHNASWFFRYEAYLVAINVSGAVIVLFSFMQSRAEIVKRVRAAPLGALVAFGLFAIIVTPIWRRARLAFNQVPTACGNIYRQQVQMARFVKKYLPGQPVAINDIGAVGFYGDSPIIDMEGLSSREVAKAKDFEIYKRLTEPQTEQLTKNAAFIALYTEWYPNGFPSYWLDLGTWVTPNSIVCAFPTVHFWAPTDASYPGLFAAMREFRKDHLPKDVPTHGFIYDVEPGASRPDTVSVGDAIRVQIEGKPELSGVGIVPPTGSLTIGAYGNVRAVGRTLAELDAETAKVVAESKLGREKGAPKVTFTMLEHHETRRIRVIAPPSSGVRAGDAVRQPGEFEMSRFMPQFNIGENVKFHIWRHTEPMPKRLDSPFAPDFQLENNDIIVVDAP